VNVTFQAENVAQAVAPVRTALEPLAVMVFTGSALVAVSNFYSASRAGRAAQNPATPVLAVGGALLAIAAAIQNAPPRAGRILRY
jgi:hypothetical protein